MDVPDGLELYRRMCFLRCFEERVDVLYRRGLVHGPAHLGLGQEAVAVGAAAVLGPGDFSLGTYRGHAHALARGAPPDAVLAELLGRQGGICQGKGGSMHITSVEHGYYGSYAIVGAHLPIACGLAWAAKIRRTGAVTMCFFGDGTTNIGAFHEAVNLAAVWRLPVVFVCLGWGAAIAALAAEEAFGDLTAPVVRVSGGNVPLPVAASLEAELDVSAARVASAARAVVKHG
jgi:acetoin:2,6-dichlorophenolindophenol oxidoreductase subunit alpha